jgi:acetyl-CoA carboxylase biotin carboxylase subunit
MFKKVLVANRGAVAARVTRALQQLGIMPVAVYSEADVQAPYLAAAAESYCIGPAPPRQSYLNIPVLLEVIQRSRVDAVHPGYGFLSENPEFARQVLALGVMFIGPDPHHIETMGHKTRARELVARNGMPVSAGSGILPDDPLLIAAAAEEIGYPVLVKPAAGGGGIGMIVASTPGDLQDAIARSRSMAIRSFGNGEIYLERLLHRPRHIEIQVIGDRHGSVRHLFERDCSVQRRHQKVIEEATAPGISRAEIVPIAERTARAMQGLGYDNIGTAEFLRSDDGNYSFLEVNTRLQVEHGVTEEITGIDLVQAQIRIAAGGRLADLLPEAIMPSGHAIEARVYAEDPKRFLPSPGRLERFRPPQGDGLRVEVAYAEGATVTPFYDPLLAKVIVRATTRDAAITLLQEALQEFEIAGVRHNIPALMATLGSEAFRSGSVHTGLLSTIQSV